MVGVEEEEVGETGEDSGRTFGGAEKVLEEESRRAKGPASTECFGLATVRSVTNMG